MIYASENQTRLESSYHFQTKKNEYWKAQQWARTEGGQLGTDWDVYLKPPEMKVKQGNLKVEVLIYRNEPGLVWAKFLIALAPSAMVQPQPAAKPHSATSHNPTCRNRERIRRIKGRKLKLRQAQFNRESKRH